MRARAAIVTLAVALLLYVVQLERVASGDLIEAGLFGVTGGGMILLVGAHGGSEAGPLRGW